MVARGTDNIFFSGVATGKLAPVLNSPPTFMKEELIKLTHTHSYKLTKKKDKKVRFIWGKGSTGRRWKVDERR